MFRNLLIVILIIVPQLYTYQLLATVILKDSTITWQHHRFTLNNDLSMASVTKDNNDIVQVNFEGKVIENEYFRIVLIPGYGGRVISYYYKPTGHEYLYQSPCGTPYGIGDGNFYYDWLMVYGGIFPTFPESEHGKMWLKPWEFEVLKQTSDTVIVSMTATDNTQYVGRPGQFNNGITGMVCEVRIGVYAGRTNFSFDVRLSNPTNQSKKYEYWTCTTLTPGSDPENTYSPLNSEIVVPATQYEAAWSPGGWIGKYGSVFDFSWVNMLSNWTDMGIGYVTNLADDYWGVINHENAEGFFRISDRKITKGLKLWTWGRNAANANPFFISNGGRDDYIELWGGVSSRFFEDAQMAANSSLNWTEHYFPTVGLNTISAMNQSGGIQVDITGGETGMVQLDSKLFLTNVISHQVDIYLNEDSNIPVYSEELMTSPLGNTITHQFYNEIFKEGENTLTLTVKDTSGDVLLLSQKQINIVKTNLIGIADEFPVKLLASNNKTLIISLQSVSSGKMQIISLDGKPVYSGWLIDGQSITMPSSGIYIIKIQLNNRVYTEKIVVK